MINNIAILNIYKKKNISSELISQLVYGEKFTVLIKFNKWLKIKTDYDGYIGFVKRKDYQENFDNTHKVFKLKSNVYSEHYGKFKFTGIQLPFNSRVKIIDKKRNYIKFSTNKWLHKRDIKNIGHKVKKYYEIFKIFLNTKYLWGGKTYKGIDCSALIQSFYHYNNIYCPRDSKDQIKFFKKFFNKKFTKADILIYWKGHVACTINNKKLIHAYGPKKSVLIMNTNKTINEIKIKSNLKVKGLRKLNVIR
tara:strand:- start:1032 stop:1781 length:750 start_codon:yes stop_codon:yes gene_type:complete